MSIVKKSTKNPAQLPDTFEEYDVHGARLSRRRFLGYTGALVVTLAANPKFSNAQTANKNSISAKFPESWIEIHSDNSIVIRTGKCDFGQSSIYTAYRQIVAEELCVSVDSIKTVISGDTDRTPDGGGTFGLLRTNVLNLRKVAAYTREAVMELAAQKFGVPRSSILIKGGVISADARNTTYGDIVSEQNLTLEIPTSGELTSFRGIVVEGEPPLKDPSEYTEVGKPVVNPIIPPKVSGETVWVGDVKLPGMLHARVIHPATLGSELVEPGNLDKSQFPNTSVVAIGNLLAVVSPNEWESVLAARNVATTTQWSDWEGLPGSDNLQNHLRREIDWNEVSHRDGANKGNIETADVSKYHEASYFIPYHKHAPIGPTVSLANVEEDGSVTVHTHSQNPQYLRMLIAKMLSEDEDKVVIRTYPGPGHFGRSNGGNAGSEDEAVLLSRELKAPVRVQWMRDDDMQWSTQSSTMLSDIRIGLDDEGNMATYEAVHSGPPMQDDRPIGAVLAGLPTISAPFPENPMGLHSAELFIADTWLYGNTPNVKETGRGTYQIGQRESPIDIGLRDHSMRTPIQFQQNFPRESAINEAAALAEIDAIQFRIDNTDEPRFKIILDKLRQESGWDTRRSPSPNVSSGGNEILRGRGVSIMLRDNGYWACAAHIAVTPDTGNVKVEKVTLVCDPGIVVNPLQLKKQATAGCLMGISQTLHEEVAFDHGKITSTDWMTYPILTMAEVPEVNVVLSPYEGASIYGQGSESANALAASAIAGAFFDATGKPARRIPLRSEYVRSILSTS